MKIAVDVDGVLLDLMDTYCEVYNEQFETNYKKSDVTRWDFFEEWEIRERDAFEIFHKIYENSSDIPFIDEYALFVLKEINEIHHVDIVSARSEQYSVQLGDTLKSHGIIDGIHYQHLILVNEKPYDIKLRLNYDLYIDDNPHLAWAIKERTEIVLFLYDQPWNRNINEKNKKNIFRVKNWIDINREIKGLELLLE
ncbi:MAG: putative NT5C domain containing protein [Promethearchaeota archaeon]|nr:MAG: putative NT5C domain containing protein [Candidatus Lokiarchaeota archaeon]